MAKETTKDSIESFLEGKVFFRIGEVAEICRVKPHVIRYWESEFAIVAPPKSSAGQRVYKKTDIENLLLIKRLLYTERYSIEGARKRIQELRRSGGLNEARTQAKDALVGVKGTAFKLKRLLADIQTARSLVFKY